MHTNLALTIFTTGLRLLLTGTFTTKIYDVVAANTLLRAYDGPTTAERQIYNKTGRTTVDKRIH